LNDQCDGFDGLSVEPSPPYSCAAQRFIDPVAGELDYEERKGVSVNDTIKWANGLPYLVTLYLDDEV
jgi:hypothetical protein